MWAPQRSSKACVPSSLVQHLFRKRPRLYLDRVSRLSPDNLRAHLPVLPSSNLVFFASAGPAPSLSPPSSSFLFFLLASTDCFHLATMSDASLATSLLAFFRNLAMA